MKILVDARPFVDPLQGGVTRVATGLMPAFVQSMPGDTFIFATTGLKKPSLPFAQHQHLSLPNKVWSSICTASLSSLDRAFRHHQPDVLLLPNIGFIGKPAIPYALIVHDLSFIIEPRWYSWKGRLWHKAVHATSLIREATILFTVSERTKQDLIDILHLPPERIFVIPLGCEMSSVYQERPLVLDGSRYMVALGGDNVRKNAACAIEAVRELRQEALYKDVLLILFGASPDARYPAHVIPLRRPNDEGRDALLRHASAFLYPSWYEGFGLPLHEAAAWHIPCIASTAGALPETAPAGTLFALPSKPQQWTEAMRLILNDPPSYQTTSSLGGWGPAAAIMRDAFQKMRK